MSDCRSNPYLSFLCREQQWQAVRIHEFAMYVTHALDFVVGGGLLVYSQRWWGSRTDVEPGPSPD